MSIIKTDLEVKKLQPHSISKKLSEINKKSTKLLYRYFPELYRYMGRIVKLKENNQFPQRDKANKKIKLGPNSYLLAYGGDLSVKRIVEAAKLGISPLSVKGEPYLWWIADKRCVLFLDNIHIERSVKSLIKKDLYTFTVDNAFLDVIYGCRDAHSSYVWLTDERIASFQRLHESAYSHSIELWRDDELIGGILGFHIGEYFHIESMYKTINNGSKYLFVALCLRLKEFGFKFIDCGSWPTNHLKNLGCTVINNDEYLSLSNNAMLEKSPISNWKDLFKEFSIKKSSDKYFNAKQESIVDA